MKKDHYVDNEEFLKAMIEFKNRVEAAKDAGRPRPQVPTYVAESILKISTNLSYKHYWSKYPFREDMVYDGVENCLRYIDNFDPNFSNNPFSYFTTIITYAFYRKIEKEKTYLYTKYKTAQHTNTIEETSEKQVHDLTGDFNDDIKHSEYSEQYMNEFIDKYETSKREKLKRRKEAKLEKEAKANEDKE